jgi:predicted RNA binding protein YcfA (HicA-like mRNA interferase family)
MFIKGIIMKKRIVDYLESLGFNLVSYKTSSRMIFHRDNITVTVEEKKK